jgi:hypothetical protein
MSDTSKQTSARSSRNNKQSKKTNLAKVRCSKAMLCIPVGLAAVLLLLLLQPAHTIADRRPFRIFDTSPDHQQVDRPAPERRPAEPAPQQTETAIPQDGQKEPETLVADEIQKPQEQPLVTEEPSPLPEVEPEKDITAAEPIVDVPSIPERSTGHDDIALQTVPPATSADDADDIRDTDNETQSPERESNEWGIPYRVFGMVGYGDGSSWAGGLGVGISFPPIEQWKGPGAFYPCIEATYTYWSGSKGIYNNGVLKDAGFTILLRNDIKQLHHGVFLEGGFGLHHMSAKQFSNKNIGGHRQASSNLAIGWYVPNTSLEISIRIRHLSNAGTRQDNSGVNQGVLRIAMRF